MKLGERIRNERIKKNISQSVLGDKLQVTQQAVGRWEKNLSEPDTSTLKKLAEIFGVSVDYLVDYKVLKPTSEWTDEEKALGVGRRATYLSEDEWEWLELRSEVIRTKGEDYLKTLIVMIDAVTKT